jgi:hypothetical protein
VRAQAPGARDADRRSPVLLVRTRGDERVVLHLRAELDPGAWRIAEIGPDAELDARPLSELAAEHSSAAALRVQAELAQVELWIARAPRSESGTLERLAAGGARPGDRVLALRVAEVLRARVLKPEAGGAVGAPSGVQSGPGAQAGEAPAASGEASATRGGQAVSSGAQDARPGDDAQGAPARAKTEAETETESEPETESETESESESESETESESESEAETEEEEEEEESVPRAPLRGPRLWFEVAPAVAVSPGDLGLALDLLASVRVQFSHAVSIAALGILPLWSERIEGPEGSARVSTIMLGGAFDLHTSAGALELGGGVGVVALISQMSGSAEPPLDEEEQTERTVAPLARVSLHLPLGAGIRASARVAAGLSVPELSVQFVERETARWGRPFVLGTLGIELPLLGEPP